MSILSFLLGIATGIILVVAIGAAAAALVIRRFNRNPALIGKLIAKKAVGPTLKRVS